MFSDFDIDISFIGGTAELINKLTDVKDLDLFEIKPRYREKVK
ncbi:hypothetical protein RG47T_2828 [Mucilaginibacter polytrichastri]|uniref:Uncharacterized protein n=1 Tax=Mucilaginibacter polytrichastri TaxID=1302689 RepID=A0A1Q6A036_9SPHI|nr:hypothetical protein RG47T_2828 [Mucilaginibacter polytrichastri]